MTETGRGGDYVTGGTLELNHRSYVVRGADDFLCDGLSRGEFCYVLTSRQMGKSSLVVRTAARLRAEGAAVAALDLTAIGCNLTPEQWYSGMLLILGQSLGLEDELEDFWADHEGQPPLLRWMRAVHDLVLGRIGSRIVIFIDEIDYVLSLPFSTDEFFAAIRECYNRRSTEPEMGRLTFCLVGVASPSDLIRDTRTTPFNIGLRVELKDFTAEEAAPLGFGLNREGRARDRILRRVLYWTNGHPYLTQQLCREVAEAPGVAGPGDVDRLTATLFLSQRARQTERNLQFVSNRLLSGETSRADLLELLDKVRRGRRVIDDEADPKVSVLRLSGLVRADGGVLRYRNRIYRQAFGRNWIEANLPDAEARRQKAAYYRGLRRALAGSIAVVTVIGGLAVYAVVQSRKAVDQRRIADREKLLAQEKVGQLEKEKADKAAVQRSAALVAFTMGLGEFKSGRIDDGMLWLARALEVVPEGAGDVKGIIRANLAVWRRQLHALKSVTEHESPVVGTDFAADGKHLIIREDGESKVLSVATGQALKFPKAIASASFSADGRRLLTIGGDGAGLWDLSTGLPVMPSIPMPDERSRASFSPDDKLLMVAGGRQARFWEAATGRPIGTPMTFPEEIESATLAPDGRSLVTVAVGAARLWDLATGTPRGPALRPRSYLLDMTHSPDGKRFDLHFVNESRQLDPTTGRPIGRPISVPSGTLREYSPDGRHLVGYLKDEVRLWDASTGAMVGGPVPHASPVHFSTFSPDSRTLLTVAGDVATFRDAATGRVLGEPRMVAGGLINVEFSPDGRRLLHYGNARAEIWDLTGDRPIPIVMEPHERIHSAFFAHGGTRLIIDHGGSGRQFEVRDAATGRRMVPPDQGKEAQRLSFLSRDNRRCATIVDGVLQLWDVATGEALGGPEKVQDGTSWAEFSPDGTRFAIQDESEIALGDATTGRITGRLRPDLSDGRTIDFTKFSPDGRYVLATALERAWLWDARTREPVTIPVTIPGGTVAVDFTADGRRLTFLGSGRARLWDLAASRSLGEVAYSDDPAGTRAVFSPDGGRLASFVGASLAGLADVTNGRPMDLPAPIPCDPGESEFSPDSRFLVLRGPSGTTVLDAITGRPLLPMTGADRVVYRPECKAIATERGGLVQLFDAETGLPLGDPVMSPGTISEITFGADGRLMATSGDAGAQVWDMASARALEIAGAALRIEFSPDSRRFLSYGVEQTKSFDLEPDGSIRLSGGFGGGRAGRVHDRVKFSKDGRYVMARERGIRSAAEGDHVVVLDVMTGSTQLQNARAGTKFDRSKFSPDGRLVKFAGGREVEVYSIEMARRLPIPGVAEDVAFSPDGSRLVVVGGGQARLLESRAGATQVGNPIGWQKGSDGLTFSRDGRLVAIFGVGGVRLFEAVTGQALGQPLKTLGDVKLASFSPDGGSLIASGGHEVRLWDVAEGRPMRVQCRSSITAYSPDRMRMATASGSEARVWDLTRWRPLGATLKHRSKVGTLEFSNDGLRLATFDELGGARVWDATTGKELISIMDPGGQIDLVQFSPDGKRLLTASPEGAMLRDSATGAPLWAKPLPSQGDTSTFAFSHDGRILLMVFGAEARRYDAARGTLLDPPFLLGGEFQRIEHLDEDLYKAAIICRGRIHLWDIAEDRPQGPPLPFGGDAARDICFSDDRRLMMTSEGEVARIWDLAGPGSLQRTIRVRGKVARARFSPDGKTLAIKDEAGVELWDVATGAKLGPSRILRGADPKIVFTPDGRRMLTAALDEVKLWDAVDGKLLAKLRLSGDAKLIAFGPKGCHRLAISVGQEVHIWDTLTGEPVGQPLQVSGQVKTIRFSPDGESLGIAGERSVGLWRSRDVRPLGPVMDILENIASFEFDGGGKNLFIQGEAYCNVVSIDKADDEGDFDWAAWSRSRIGSSLDSNNAKKILNAHEHEKGRDPGPPASGPAPAGQGPRAWHWYRADASETDRDWFAAKFHLDALLRLTPGDGELSARRARAEANLGNWVAADTDFRAALGSGVADLDSLYESTLIRWKLGDPAGYREACLRLLGRTDDLRDPRFACAVARLCSLEPGPIADHEVLLKLARAAEKSPLVGRHEALSTLGLVLYRGGRRQEALRYIEGAIKAAGARVKPADPVLLDLLRDGLAKAGGATMPDDRWLPVNDQGLPIDEPGRVADDQYSCFDQLEGEILRREAKRLASPLPNSGGVPKRRRGSRKPPTTFIPGIVP